MFNSGIGAAICLALAKSGATLALLDLSASKQDATRTACAREGVKVKAYSCNVADLENARKVLGEIERELGVVE
jgi:NAD(P)-dependent dehydrogenase (short-subunit alcohol dehydrogenase family)